MKALQHKGGLIIPWSKINWNWGINQSSCHFLNGSEYTFYHLENGSYGYKNMPNINLQNEALHDLIGEIPKGILAWGIIGIFSVVALLLGMTWFISYPDLVSEKILISSVPPPARIYAPEGTKISHFFVKNGQQVTTGEYLAVIENAANTQKVLQLETLLKQWETNQQFSVSYFPMLSGLGELESSYFIFVENLRKWAHYQEKMGAETLFLDNTQAQIGQTQNLSSHIYAERALLEQELALLKKQWETQSRNDRRSADYHRRKTPHRQVFAADAR